MWKIFQGHEYSNGSLYSQSLLRAFLCGGKRMWENSLEHVQINRETFNCTLNNTGGKKEMSNMLTVTKEMSFAEVILSFQILHNQEDLFIIMSVIM